MTASERATNFMMLTLLLPEYLYHSNEAHGQCHDVMYITSFIYVGVRCMRMRAFVMTRRHGVHVGGLRTPTLAPVGGVDGHEISA